MTSTKVAIEAYLTADDLAEFFGRDRGTIWKRVKRGALPPPLKSERGEILGWTNSYLQRWQQGVIEASLGKAISKTVIRSQTHWTPCSIP